MTMLTGIRNNFTGCYCSSVYGYLWPAVDLGLLTEEEWRSLCAPGGTFYKDRATYEVIRGMMAMFVLLSEGEKL